VSEFEKILKVFAEEVNLAAKRELGSRKIGKNRSYGVASRSLQKSLEYKISGGRVSFGSPLPYAAFIHWGVNGTERTAARPTHIETKTSCLSDAIRKWMKVKPVRVRDKDGRFVKATESRLQSAAFLIARSIKRNGIEGLRYYEAALEAQVPKFQTKLGEALAQDLLKSLEFKSGNITIKPK
jgi:hypothetical protein